MATLYTVHREKALFAARRRQFLGREFLYGNIVILVIDVSRVDNWPLKGTRVAATCIALRWRDPDLFRWNKWHPEKRHHSTGTVTPGHFRPTRWGGGKTVLPDHTPFQFGLHNLNRPLP